MSETVLEESPESQNSLFSDSGHSSETVSGTFWTGAGRSRKTLSETLRGFQARRAQETPLRGGRDPNASVQRTQSTLTGHSAVPRGTNTTRMNADRAIRIAAQRMQGL